MSLYDDEDEMVKEKESKVAGWSQVRVLFTFAFCIIAYIKTHT